MIAHSLHCNFLPTDISWTWFLVGKLLFACRRPSAVVSSVTPQKRTHRRATERSSTSRWSTFTLPARSSTDSPSGEYPAPPSETRHGGAFSHATAGNTGKSATPFASWTFAQCKYLLSRFQGRPVNKHTHGYSFKWWCILVIVQYSQQQPCWFMFRLTKCCGWEDWKNSVQPRPNTKLVVCANLMGLWEMKMKPSLWLHSAFF